MPTQRASLTPALLALAAAALGACSSTPPDQTAGARDVPDLPERAPAAPATEPAAPARANPYAGILESQWPANYQTIHIKVRGMTCPLRCVREVTEMLQVVHGVLRVRIEYDEQEAIVDVTPGTDPEAVLHGLKGVYSGRLL